MLQSGSRFESVSGARGEHPPAGHASSSFPLPFSAYFFPKPFSASPLRASIANLQVLPARKTTSRSFALRYSQHPRSLSAPVFSPDQSRDIGEASMRGSGLGDVRRGYGNHDQPMHIRLLSHTMNAPTLLGRPYTSHSRPHLLPHLEPSCPKR